MISIIGILGILLVIEALLNKIPKVVPGKGELVHYIFFGRSDFSEEAMLIVEAAGAGTVDLTDLGWIGDEKKKYGVLKRGGSYVIMLLIK